MREREDNMTSSVIHLAIGLVLLVAVNIVLGGMNALFDGTFDKVKLRHGIIKGVIVAACFIAFIWQDGSTLTSSPLTLMGRP